MRKATLDIVNIELEKMGYIYEAAVASSELREKLARSAEVIRTALTEDAAIYSGQRRGVKAARTNLVLKNPALVEAAEKLINMPVGDCVAVEQLCDEKYLRVVITYVRTKVPDFHYYTYNAYDSRMLVKTSGVLEDAGEKFDPTF